MKKYLQVLSLILIFVFISCSSVDSLIKKDKLDEAVNYCNKEDKEDKRLCYEKVADAYFEKNDFFNAEKYYGEFYADNITKRRKSELKIAEFYIKKGKYDSALIYYEKAGKEKTGKLKVAKIYLKNKRLNDAYNIYKPMNYIDGLKKIADIYYDNGEYLRALKLYTDIGMRKRYVFDIAKKIELLKDYQDAALLYKEISSIIRYKNSYKKLGFYLLDKNEAYNIKFFKSRVSSILKSDDYIFVITKNGKIWQSYLYDENFKNVFSLLEGEKIYKARYIKRNNQIILLTNKGLLFYDIVSKSKIRRLNKPVTAFSVTDDENFLITAEGKKILVRDFETLDELMFFEKHTARVDNLISFKDTVISAGKDKIIRAWNMETGKELYKLRGHFLDILSIEVNKEKSLLLSASKDKSVIIWDLKRKKKLKKIKFEKYPQKVFFDGGENHVFVVLNDRIYALIDTNSYEVRYSELFHDSNITSMNIGKYNNFIYSGDERGGFFVSFFNKDEFLKEIFAKADLTKKEYFDLAERYFKRKKYETAAYYYEISVNPEKGLYKIANAYYELENYDEALKYFKKLNDKESLRKIAEIYFKLGDYDNAAQYYIRIKDNEGVLKSAEMFLYEENYYDAVRLYRLLIKEAEETSDTVKLNELYLKIAKLFIDLKDVEYKGTEDDEFNKQITEKLKKWYQVKYDLALSYFEKAQKRDEGAIYIAKYLCDKNEFEKALYYLNEVESKDVKKIVKNCKSKAGDFFYLKAAEEYKNFINLVKEDGDWNLITSNFNMIKDYLSKSKVYYKSLKNYKKIRKINKIERKLKYYKRKLGL